MQQLTNRLAFVDHMKALGIVAVVVGHAPGLSLNIEMILYGFHVPLFFFIAGVLLSDQRLNSTSLAFIYKQFKEILIPYFVFFTISYAYWLVTRHHGNSASRFANIGWEEPIQGFLFGTGSSIIVNVVLWFFPALFCAKLIYFLAYNVFGKLKCLAVLAILAFGFFQLQEYLYIRLFFGLDCAIYGILFLAIGNNFRSNLISASQDGRKTIIALFGIVFLLIYIALVKYNGKVDLNNVHIGNFFLYYIVALIGCWIIFSFSCFIRSNFISLWLSTHTLYIFPLHWLFFRVTTGLLQVFFAVPSPYTSGGPIWTLVYATIGIVMVLPAVWIISKLPFEPFTYNDRQAIAHSA